MPRLLNKHIHGIPEGAVYIGRGSPYGNPYKIGSKYNRENAIRLFEENILPDLDVSELRGRDLVCFCWPKPCHGNSILKKAND